jgi:hypothetical protein
MDLKKIQEFFYGIVRKISGLHRKKHLRRIIIKSGLFDPAYYAERNPDVRQAGAEPLKHYLCHGFKEGRNPSAKFDTGYYLTANPDVLKSGMNPLLHYILHGIREGRSPVPPKVIESHSGALNRMNPESELKTLHVDYTIKVVFPLSLQSELFSPPGTPDPKLNYFDEVYLLTRKTESTWLSPILEKLWNLNIEARVVEVINGAHLPHLYEYNQYARLPAGAEHSPPWEKVQGKKAIGSPEAWGLLKTWRMVLRDAQTKGCERILIFSDPITHESAEGQISSFIVKSEDYHAVGIDGTSIPLILEGLEKFDRTVGHVLMEVYGNRINECTAMAAHILKASEKQNRRR